MQAEYLQALLAISLVMLKVLLWQIKSLLQSTQWPLLQVPQEDDPAIELPRLVVQLPSEPELRQWREAQ